MTLKNIREHFLVPKHEIVPSEKVDEVLSKYGCTVDSLPKILPTDPIVEEINAIKGDVIKITRNSSTAGEAVYFRTVI